MELALSQVCDGTDQSPKRSGSDLETAEAFERFYADHGDRVRAVVRRHLWGPVVDDVVQEAFAQAFRSGLHLEFARGDDVASRLSGIARNRSIDVLRRRMRGGHEIGDDGRLEALESPWTDADPEAHLLGVRRRAGIAEVLDSLCARQRRVLVMRHIEGLAYEEIAEREEMTVDAVKASLARARKSFRHMYASVAERDGLSVLLGGSALRRAAMAVRERLAGVRPLLRRTRDRVATGFDQALGNLTNVAPGIANATVATVVAGSIAIMGSATAAASEADQAGFAPALAAYMHAMDVSADAAEAALARADAQAEAEPTDGSVAVEEAPADEPEAAAEPTSEPPEAEAGTPPVSQSASTSVSTEEAVGTDDAPAQAEASASASTQANPEQGSAESEQQAAADGEADIVEAAPQVVNELNLGCIGNGGPVSSTVCPVVAGP